MEYTPLLVLALDSRGIINTLKRYCVALECADFVAFTLCEYLLWVKANEVNYLAVSSQ